MKYLIFIFSFLPSLLFSSVIPGFNPQAALDANSLHNVYQYSHKDPPQTSAKSGVPNYPFIVTNANGFNAVFGTCDPINSAGFSMCTTYIEYYNTYAACPVDTVLNINSNECELGCISPLIFDTVTHSCVNPPLPVCIEPQILNDINSSCIYPQELSITIPFPDTDPNVTLIKYESGHYQICDTIISSCATYTRNGIEVPNIPVNGITYSTLSQIHSGQFLSMAGYAIASVAGTLAVVGSGGLATPFVTAGLATTSIYAGLFSVGNEFLGVTPYSINSSLNDNISSSLNGFKIDLVNTDLTQEADYVSNSVDTSGNKVSTMINNDGSLTEITFEPTQIVTKEYILDGSIIETVVQNTAISPVTTNDFSEVNNPSNIDYVVTTTEPDVINNDGTVTSGAVSTVSSSLSPVNNSSSVTSSSNVSASTSSSSVPSSSTSSSTSSSSDGSTSSSTQDLKPVTDRLNQIISQNSKINKSLTDIKSSTSIRLSSLIDKATERNIKLDDIKNAIIDINGTDMTLTNDKLDSINSEINTTNSLLEDIKDNLLNDSNKSYADTSSFYNVILTEFSDFRDNIALQNDNIKSQADSIQASLDGGFINNLPDAVVTSCPYSKDINFGFAIVPFTMDICSIFSNLYSTFYFLFYILFFATSLSFVFKLLFSTRSE